MSYNGSGTFNINTAGQPVVTGTVISSSVFNALTADLATGLSTAITKDGQTTITNNIPFNGYKITNLGAGTASTDAVRLGQLQAGTATAITVTGTDTYTGTMSPALASYTAGNTFSFVVPNTNTTGCTLNIDGQGAKAITRDGSTALIAGDLVAGSEVVVIYDGTRFQVLNSNSKTNWTVSNALTLSGGTANGVAYLNGSKALTTGSALTFDGTNFTLNSGDLSIYSGGPTRNLTMGPASAGLQYNVDGNLYINSRNDGYAIGFKIASSEQMRLTSTGLGIGTSSPGAKLHVNGSGIFDTNGTGGSLSIYSYGALVGQIRTPYTGAYNQLAYNVISGGSQIWSNNSVEQMRLDSSGNLGLGVTPSAWSTGRAIEFGAVGNSLWGYSGNTILSQNTAGYSGGFIYATTAAATRYQQNAGSHAWYVAPSGTAGTAISFTQAMTLTSGGNLLIGRTSSAGSAYSLELDNNSTDNRIGMYVSGSLTGGLLATTNELRMLGLNASTVLTFQTNGAERARIDSSGNLGLGATSITALGSGYTTMAVQGTNGAGFRLYAGSTEYGRLYADSTGTILQTVGAVPQIFYVNGAERARIDTSGNLLVGTTVGGQPDANAAAITVADGAFRSHHATGTASNTIHAYFTYGGLGIGSITQNGTTGVSYNTSSDYRLKDKQQALTGSGAFIDALKPKTWEWKADGSKGVGFIAHEVAEVSPASVVGEKDAVDADGKPVYQAMEYGSAEFIANIVAELQSLRARVAQLESKGA